VDEDRLRAALDAAGFGRVVDRRALSPLAESPAREVFAALLPEEQERVLASL
jgi:hypothetical protein